MYYVVTGAAGFIGSNLVRALNEHGETDIIAVDNLSRADKFLNLADCEIADFIDKRDFVVQLSAGEFEGAIEAVLHQGACSDTMETDGRYMMENNYRYSVALLDYCQEEEVPLLYASSASVYGSGKAFRELRECEAPLNIYGYSKFLFDQVVAAPARCRKPDRWLSLFQCLRAERGAQGAHGFGRVPLLQPVPKRTAGQAVPGLGRLRRRRAEARFHLRRGRGRGEHAFYRAAGAVGDIQSRHRPCAELQRRRRGHDQCLPARRGQAALTLEQMRARNMIEYIAFPDALKGKYQSYTEADSAALRRAGYTEAFLTVEEGVSRYCEHLLGIGK